jgi:peroxiredoxin
VGLSLAAMLIGAGCTKDSGAPPEGAGNRPEVSDSTAIETPPDDNGPVVAEAADHAVEEAPEDTGTVTTSETTLDQTPAPDNDVETSPPADVQSGGNGVKQPAASGIPQPPPPAELHKPEVILSQHHAQTCLVGVGDPFPNLTLPDLEGNSRELTQLYGDRMTIVVFWTSKGLYAREQFSRIMYECHDRYGALGVRVVAINVGDSPEVVQELATQHGVTIPCLLDADGAAFDQVAADLLPRIYLLDAAGRILWFDLEYSRSQRLALHNAVYFHVKQNGA